MRRGADGRRRGSKTSRPAYSPCADGTDRRAPIPPVTTTVVGLRPMMLSRHAVAFALLTAGCGQVPSSERPAPPRPGPAAPSCDGALVAPDPWQRDASAHGIAARAEALASLAQDIGPAFSHDGRSVVYSSTRGGQPELYVAPRERPGDARRLLGTANAVLGQQFTWDDRAVLFTADRNGDEHWHILRAELATGTVTDLTPTRDT